MKHRALRRLLQERRDRLDHRLGQIRRDRRRIAQPLSADFAEQAVERENDEALDFLDARLRSDLRETEEAIARVDQGAYGICVGCGNGISEQRLESLPTTPVCASCAAGAQP